MDRLIDTIFRLVNRGITSHDQVSSDNTLPGFRIAKSKNESGIRQRAIFQPSPGFRVTNRELGKAGNLVVKTFRLIKNPRIVPEKRTFPKQTFMRRRASWEDFGWRLDRPGVYIGEYLVGSRRWRGRAEFPAKRGESSQFDIYCYHPPAQLRAYGHRACWHHVGNGWYWIHFNKHPQDLASGIRNIENSIAEMIGGF